MNCSNIIELEILEDETNMDLNVEFQGDIIRLGSGGEFIETDPTVPDWAKQPEKPKYTAEEIGTLTAEQIESAINQIKLTPGPKGDTGEQGPRGEQGLAGDNGQDGLTPTINEEGNWQIGDIDTGVKAVGSDGKSAYEIAKENGFEGAETEWLESLKGIIDLNYNPESENAQSGKAVAEVIDTVGHRTLWFNSFDELCSYPFKKGIRYYVYINFVLKSTDDSNLEISYCRCDCILQENYDVSLRPYMEKYERKPEFEFVVFVQPYSTPYRAHFYALYDTELKKESTNAVQNKVITEAINNINSQLGDIDTALDSIISLQESYIGGEE